MILIIFRGDLKERKKSWGAPSFPLSLPPTTRGQSRHFALVWGACLTQPCFLVFAEVRVLNIVFIGVALGILITTGLYCITACYRRSRWATNSTQALITGDAGRWLSSPLSGSQKGPNCMKMQWPKWTHLNLWQLKPWRGRAVSSIPWPSSGDQRGPRTPRSIISTPTHCL